MTSSKVKIPVVTGRSREVVEISARALLKRFNPEILKMPMPSPVLEIFEDFMGVNYGFTPLIQELPAGLEGRTNITDKTVELDLSTHEALENGDGRARFSAAHEIGHVDLHGDERSFSIGSLGILSLSYARKTDIPAYQNPEWQANTFACELLMPKPMVRIVKEKFKGQELIDALVEIFKVSRTAAQIRLNKM